MKHYTNVNSMIFMLCDTGDHLYQSLEILLRTPIWFNSLVCKIFQCFNSLVSAIRQRENLFQSTTSRMFCESPTFDSQSNSPNSLNHPRI
ncbi:hypothetical protein Hanom_Chr08g00743361 [Helianthus anomalus]